MIEPRTFKGQCKDCADVRCKNRSCWWWYRYNASNLPPLEPVSYYDEYETYEDYISIR